MPLRRLSIALAATALLASTDACAGLLHAASGNAYNLESAHIVFVNQTTDQAAVYAIMESGETERIGTVLPGRGDTLTIPPAMIANGGGVAIAARLLAQSNGTRTGLLSLQAGDVFEVILQADERAMRVIRLPSRPEP